MVGAVIYRRVSTKEQTKNSLPTQLHACEEYTAAARAMKSSAHLRLTGT